MFHFLAYTTALFCLTTKVDSFPTNSSLNLPPSSQYEYKDKQTGALKPYVPFDYDNWHIDSSLYKGVPMTIKTTVIDGKKVKYQDFDLEKLSKAQLRQFVFNGDEYILPNGSHSILDEEIEYLREVFVSHDLGIKHRGVGTVPRGLQKRGGLDNACWEEKSTWCKSSCTYSYTRSLLQSVNRDVYGYFHYDQSDPLCGPGTISRGFGMTSASSLSFSAKIDLQTWGKGFLKTASQMLKDVGLGITKVPDSSTVTITYSGQCYPYTRCEQWYRPHFQVFKGLTILSVLAADQETHCIRNQQSSWEAHTPYAPGDNGGPFTHGICQRANAGGCQTIRPHADMDYCR